LAALVPDEQVAVCREIGYRARLRARIPSIGKLLVDGLYGLRQERGSEISAKNWFWRSAKERSEDQPERQENAEPWRAEVRSVSDLARRYNLRTADEYVGPESSRYFLDYGPPVILADSSQPSARKEREADMWQNIIDRHRSDVGEPESSDGKR
jgi:hypothetical protein